MKDLTLIQTMRELIEFQEHVSHFTIIIIIIIIIIFIIIIIIIIYLFIIFWGGHLCKQLQHNCLTTTQISLNLPLLHC